MLNWNENDDLRAVSFPLRVGASEGHGSGIDLHTPLIFLTTTSIFGGCVSWTDNDQLLRPPPPFTNPSGILIIT